MSTFVLIHGAGDVGWYWHLVEAELQARGHGVVAPDLPGDDDSLTLDDYADAVVEAVGDRHSLVVVGQSFGAFTAPLVAVRRPVEALVLVAGMVPEPGESPGQWWSNTGCTEAVRRQAARDGGLTGSDDPYVAFYHDVPRELAEEAMSKERAHPSSAASAQPWPLDAWPAVPTRFVLCTEDRLFPPDFLRRLVLERLGGARTRSPRATVLRSAALSSWPTFWPLQLRTDVISRLPRSPTTPQSDIKTRRYRSRGRCLSPDPPA